MAIDILPVGRVDCTAHATLCSRYGVQGYPTIKAFYDKGKTLDYNMQREAVRLSHRLLSVDSHD